MLPNVELPSWLYEILPYSYFAVGALALISFENLPGHFAGATLIAAGVLTLLMRHRYRRDK